MAYGLTCFNDDGYIQVTDEFRSFVFLSKGSVALSGTQWTTAYPDTILGSNAQVSIADTFGFPPILALRCDVPVQVYRTRLVGGNWVFDIVSEQGTRTNTVHWYAFGPCPNVQTESYGLTIRNASGQITYHSGYRPMIVKSFKDGAVEGSTTSFDIGSGRKLAIALPTLRWSWTAQIPAGAWQQFLTSSTITTPTDHQGSVNQTILGASYKGTNFGFGGGSGGQWTALALDVTNY